MKTKHFLLFILLFTPSLCREGWGGSSPSLFGVPASDAQRGDFREGWGGSPYFLEVSAEYAYNRTYAHFAN
ncbi:MAG: hypothetical protein ACI4TV_07405, partial [Paludibacteraceae bacterium]